MPVVEELAVSLAKLERSCLLGAAIETPTTGGTSESYAIRVTGWAVGRDAPVEAVHAAQPNRVLTVTPVSLPRPDLAARFPETEAAARAGFALLVDTLALDPVFEVKLRAVLPDQSRLRLGTIRGRRRLLRTAYAPALRPLIVTSLGRTGTTRLMRLLAEHPQVVVYRRYPYEVRGAKYWLHLLRVLAGPAEPAKRIGQPNEFHLETLAIGGNPFYAAAFGAYPAVEAWSGSTYVERLATFCQESIDGWYGTVAASQGQPHPLYFAEKHFPDEYPRLLWEIYPRAREVVLVRDFRDMASSMLAYNVRRGFADFGRDRATSDDRWIADLRHSATQLFEAWRSRAHLAHLVRYEELVASPHDVLTPLLTYLELDASPATVDGMIRRATADAAELARHQTTDSPAASIGRWRRDLDPASQAAASAAFDDLLLRFGYDPRG